MKSAALSALTGKAIAGDNEALTDLVRIHHDRVYRFGKRFCRAEDLDDAVQGAFITLARRQDVMRHAGVVSWLFTVVKHTCLRLWRSVRREKQRLGERIDVVEASIPDEQLDPEQALLRFELVQAVQTGIAELDEESRSVIVLVDLEGFSGQHAAEALGISVPALKARLHRARNALRVSLAASVRADMN